MTYNSSMKLFNSKEDSLYLSRKQWTQLFVAFSIIALCLYVAATIATMCGSTYFILDYQNTQMDGIQDFLVKYNLYPLAMNVFMTTEFCIIISFVLKKLPRWPYVVSFYAIPMITYYILIYTVGSFNPILKSLYPFLFYLTIPIIEQLICNHKSVYNQKFSWKKYLFCLLRLAISMLVMFLLQVMIMIMKAGYFDGKNHIMNLSATFIYAIEYDIALAVILFTILLVYREKGDSKIWATSQVHGSSSQTSKKKSQKSLLKRNLTKTQKNKIRLIYVKLYLSQIGAFILVMILPFLLGKVLEFLVMYLSFVVARYILGFKYSLHYKKESLCVFVGVVVFGILSLAVPFFYVVLIIAIVLGVALAILLHLSYKYKGMFLFAQVAKPDKFALLYTFFDGNIEKHNVKRMCNLHSLSNEQTSMIVDFTQGEKLSVMAWRYNYSQRNLIYKLDEAINKLVK